MFLWKKKKADKSKAAAAASAVPKQEPALDSTDELITIRPVLADPRLLTPETCRQEDSLEKFLK